MDNHECCCTKDQGLDGTGDGARQVCLHKTLERIAEALESTNEDQKYLLQSLSAIEKALYTIDNTLSMVGS